VTAETGQPAATVNAQNISKMWARMWARSRMNSVWFYNQDIDPQFDELALPVGTGALEPRVVTYNEAGVLRIKGRPAIPTEYNATLGTVGDLVLCDLSQYLMIDKGGVQQDTSIHVRFTTAEQAFRAMYRCDGKPLWETTLTPANGSNTLSPFVALATRG
jgi:HK97 family phage major capsid protein